MDVIETGVRYRVQLKSGMAELGVCNSDERTIHVSRDQDEFSKRDTVLHEAIHAIIAETNLTQVLGDQEEFLVTSLTRNLMPLIRRLV